MVPSLTSPIGRVMSADVAVPDHEREVRFYVRVLTTGKDPLWREDLMNREGIPVIGVGQRTALYADLPLQWMPHIQVADVATSVERALSRGGREFLHHRDGSGQSQWAVLADPDGAAFGIVPAVASDTVPEIRGGRIAGLELATPDPRATCGFYRHVVGWSVEDTDAGDARGQRVDHVLRAPDGEAVARVRGVQDVAYDLAPVWLIGLPVGDLNVSLARARQEGGEVVEVRRGPGDDPGYAVLRDPVGVCFALVQGYSRAWK